MSIEQIATTEDSGETVYRVEQGDGHAEVNPSGDRIYVPSVYTPSETQMKDVLDEVVAEFEIDVLLFTNVISRDLVEKLDYDAVYREEHPATGEKVLCLAVKWDS